MTTKYIINTIDSDETSEWMSLCETVRPGNQDSGRCQFAAWTDRQAELEAALDADDSVVSYYEQGVA